MLSSSLSPKKKTREDFNICSLKSLEKYLLLKFLGTFARFPQRRKNIVIKLFLGEEARI